MSVTVVGRYEAKTNFSKLLDAPADLGPGEGVVAR
jgi:hypothetical protein